MTLDVALRQHLLGDTSIYALVAERIYPIRLPQKVALPAVTFQQISDTRLAHLRGPAGTARVRYQIDAYAFKPIDAKTLGGLIRQRMDGFAGSFPEPGSPAIGSPADTVYVQGAFFDTAMDLFDEDINGGSSRNSADYFIHHATAAGVL